MKKIIIVALILSTLLLCSCKPNVELPPVIDDTQEVEQSDIVIEDYIFTEETEFDAGVSAEVYITAPKAVAPLYGENVDKFNQLVQINVDTVKNEYLRDVAMNEGAEGIVGTSRMLTYDVYTAKDGYISVMLKVTYALSGFVTPQVAYRCINYDLKAGNVVLLSDIVGEDKVDTVKALIIEQMKENPDKYYSTKDDALKDIDINSSFLEKEDKIYVVIGEYTIAPRSAGTQIFEINKGDIA